MSWKVITRTSMEADSVEAAASCARAIVAEAAGHGVLRGAIVYFSLSHEPEEIVDTLTEILGDIPLMGASVQGIVSRELVEEGSYFVHLLGWVGDVEVSVSHVEELAKDTHAKGSELGRRAAEVADAKLSLIVYDPLGTANVRSLLRGFDEASGGLTLIGAAAGGPWGPMRQTLQVCNGDILEHAVVVMTVGGAFDVVTAASTGTEPTSNEMVVTRSEGNELLEFDGVPALDVWIHSIGVTETQLSLEDMASWALGVERGGPGREAWAVLSAFRYDLERRSIILQTEVPQGARVVLHLRSPEVILERIDQMADDLATRIGDRDVGAVLSFECGARTSPFLGYDGTLEENARLQRLVGGESPWFGLMAWGEIVPTRAATEFFNYTYPVVALCR